MTLPFQVDIGLSRLTGYLGGQVTWEASGSIVNLTGASASMPILNSLGATVLTLSSGAGDIALGGTNGTFQVSATQAQCVLLTDSTYTYTLTITISGIPTLIMQGNIMVSDYRGILPTHMPFRICEKGEQGPPGIAGELAGTVATFADLTGISSAQNGSMAYVQSRHAYFTYNPSSTQTADAVDVATAAAALGGRWLRIPTQDNAWAAQAAWYVNASTGLDDNSGAVGAPLLTLKELNRRIGSSTLTPSQVDVYLQTSFATSDPLVLQCTLGNGTSLYLHGTRTAGATGTLTSLTAMSAASNQRWQIADTVLSGGFTSYVGQMATITSGANSGGWFWIDEDLGSGSAAVTQPMATLSSTTKSLTNGDPYQLYSLPTVYLGCIHIRSILGTSPGTSQRFQYDGIRWGSAGGNDADQSIWAQARVQIYESRHDNLVTIVGGVTSSTGATSQLSNCYFAGGLNVIRDSGGCALQGGTIHGKFNVSGAAIAQTAEVLVSNGTGITVASSGSCTLTNAGIGVFKSSTDAVYVAPSGVTDSTSTKYFWGSGSTGYGIHSDSTGCRVGTKPTITGTAGDYRCATTALALTWLDNNVNPPQLRSVNQTWALWDTAAPTGFGSACVNPLTGACVVSNTSLNATAATYSVGYASVVPGAQGSVFYSGATTPAWLSPGTSGQVLTSGGASANPTWTTPSTAAASLTISGARGNILAYGASTWQAFAQGTSGYVLTSGGTGADNTWTAPTALVNTLGGDATGASNANTVVGLTGTSGVVALRSSLTSFLGNAASQSFTWSYPTPGNSETGGDIIFKSPLGGITAGVGSWQIWASHAADVHGDVSVRDYAGNRILTVGGNGGSTKAVRVSTAILGNDTDSDPLRFGRASVDIAGSSNVTLTAAQYANFIITLSGVVTGNINVILPTVDGYAKIIDNRATGAFTVTVKTSGGAGVVVAMGTGHKLVFCDGTDIIGV